MAKQFKVVVYVPVADADKLREVMGNMGAGKIGNYDFCSFSVRGVGRFRPLTGANPAIGEIGKHEQVEEERIEIQVDESLLAEFLEKVRAEHPYEEPAIDVMELRNE